jgi:ATP-dependent DNA helicase RecG
MQANGSPPAEFDFDEDHSYFMVRLPVHPAALAVADSEIGETVGVDTPQVTGQVTGQVRRLIAVCNGELSRAELQEKLGLRHRDNFIEIYLQPALNTGLLEMTIPDKPRSSKQKYRLTEKGRAAIVSLERLTHSK